MARCSSSCLGSFGEFLDSEEEDDDIELQGFSLLSADSLSATQNADVLETLPLRACTLLMGTTECTVACQSIKHNRRLNINESCSTIFNLAFEHHSGACLELWCFSSVERALAF
eukprot:COSAG01_NODE_663_length_14420_cov_77.011382_11_plen_114_part_00